MASLSWRCYDKLPEDTKSLNETASLAQNMRMLNAQRLLLANPKKNKKIRNRCDGLMKNYERQGCILDAGAPLSVVITNRKNADIAKPVRKYVTKSNILTFSDQLGVRIVVIGVF
jgi:hypothetical protein